MRLPGILSFAVLFLASPVTAADRTSIPPKVRVLHVDGGNARASDVNPGTAAKPLRTIQRAVDMAGRRPGRILIHPGTYREFVNIGPGTSPLSLDATRPGAVVISGADPVASWRNEGDGVYSFAWSHRWGTNGDQWYFPGERTASNLRREMVFLGNVRLRQRCRADKTGSALGGADLKPGEFTVDQADGRIRFRPPARARMDRSSRLEVSVRGYAPGAYPNDGKSLVSVRGRSNLTLRGLRIERACNYILANPAVSISGVPDSTEVPAHITLADCSFSHDNGVGLGVSGVDDVTIVRCEMSDNGERGGGAGNVRGLDVRDCRFFDNGWRFGPWLVGHDMAGFKIFDGATSDSWFKRRSEGVRFTRCHFRGNLCHNLWQDFGPKGTRITSCLFEESPHTAILQEVTPGPLTVINTVIRRCGTAGEAAVLLVASPDVRLEGCTVYDCGSAEKGGALVEMLGDTRTTDPKAEHAVTRLHIERCALQANRPNTYLFRTGAWNGATDARRDFAEGSVTAANVYFGADRPKEGMDLYRYGEVSFFRAPFYTGNDNWRNTYPDLTLAEWQAGGSGAGMRDRGSRWRQIPLSRLDRTDPLQP